MPGLLIGVFILGSRTCTIEHARECCCVCVQAVAALLQTDTSAIVTLASSGLDRPKKLDGKVYGSYGARYPCRVCCVPTWLASCTCNQALMLAFLALDASKGPEVRDSLSFVSTPQMASAQHNAEPRLVD